MFLLAHTNISRISSRNKVQRLSCVEVITVLAGETVLLTFIKPSMYHTPDPRMEQRGIFEFTYLFLSVPVHGLLNTYSASMVYNVQNRVFQIGASYGGVTYFRFSTSQLSSFFNLQADFSVNALRKNFEKAQFPGYFHGCCWATSEGQYLRIRTAVSVK